MGAFTLILLVAGGLFVGLVVVAVLVATWEWLREREMVESLRCDSAIYAATSPLPLAPSGSGANVAPLARPLGAPPLNDAPWTPAGAGQREVNWIETRPMVLRKAALDDDSPRPGHKRESSLDGNREASRGGNRDGSREGRREDQRAGKREHERQREAEPDLLLE